MNLETELYQILRHHKLGLKKREELIVDLLDFINKREKQLNIGSVSERLNSIDFAKYLEALAPVNRISVHPNPRTLSVDEIYDKYKKQQERNAR